MEVLFHDKLKSLMDEYVHSVYKLTRNFSSDELYGVTSQLRRSSLSVTLNYIEGFARRRSKVYLSFLETSYGSLKESIYLLQFSKKEDYIKQVDEYKRLMKMSDEIAAMLWSTIKSKLSM